MVNVNEIKRVYCDGFTGLKKEEDKINLLKGNYRITSDFLGIYCEEKEDFYKIYDIAIKEIPDNAFNKKWRRSFFRNVCAVRCGLYECLIPLK